MDRENKTKSSDKGPRRGILKTIFDLIFIAFCTGLPMFYLYIGNLKELRFQEIVPLILIFAAIGWILYLILRLALKDSRKAAFISGIVMAIITNAGLLTGAFGYIVVLVISAAVIVAAFIVFTRLVDGSIVEKIEFILTGVVAALILFNMVVSIPQLTENDRLSKEAEAKVASLEKIETPGKYASGDADLPNFYVFVFDELAGSQCMKEVFDYDNTGFYDDMRSLGFTVSDDSTNYKQFTMECLSGLFNLDYVFDYDTDGFFACQERFQNSRFFSIMKDMGYRLYETETSGFVEFEPRFQYKGVNEFSTTEGGYTTFDVIMQRTLFWPLVDVLKIFETKYVHDNEIMTYYTLPESYTYERAMTFTYICCPHAPFIYDANGAPVDDANRMNWSDSRYFLEQYQYITGRIEETMKGIIKNDPNAIILVFSDHGVKPNKYLWGGPTTNYEQSTDTFFAVYTGGRNDLGDITGLCGANVLRTVLNKEYGFNLGMIDAPAN